MNFHAFPTTIDMEAAVPGRRYEGSFWLIGNSFEFKIELRKPLTELLDVLEDRSAIRDYVQITLVRGGVTPELTEEEFFFFFDFLMPFVFACHHETAGESTLWARIKNFFSSARKATGISDYLFVELSVEECEMLRGPKFRCALTGNFHTVV